MSRLLVVDDEEDIREMFRVGLPTYGHEITTASNGQECLAELARGPKFDAVLLDLMMPGPGPDGFGVLRELMGKPHPPIVVMTAMTGNRKYAISLGAADYISKPFLIDDLAAVLARLAVEVA